MSDVSTETQTEKTFDPEAFAMNLARAMESSGQALAAFLKPRESGEITDKPPNELADWGFFRQNNARIDIRSIGFAPRDMRLIH